MVSITTGTTIFIMNIKRKLSLLNRLNEELDSHIWDVFNKYIKLKDINFNGPSTWTVCYDKIEFSGTDGCRGCYDPMWLSIDIEWFIDFDAESDKHNNALKLAEEKAKVERAKQIELSRRVKEAKDKVEYERLKKKFEG